MMQTKASSRNTGAQNSNGQNQTSQTSGSDTVEYQGATYKYNDHLSNYLFLGIDTRESVDTYQTQEDAGQADAILWFLWTERRRRLKCSSSREIL